MSNPELDAAMIDILIEARARAMDAGDWAGAKDCDLSIADLCQRLGISLDEDPFDDEDEE